ncbi:hypothetical protein AALA79_21755 [Lachnospiraceae bacterium 64-25]
MPAQKRYGNKKEEQVFSYAGVSDVNVIESMAVADATDFSYLKPENERVFTTYVAD